LKPIILALDYPEQTNLKNPKFMVKMANLGHSFSVFSMLEGLLFGNVHGVPSNKTNCSCEKKGCENAGVFFQSIFVS